MYRIIMTLIFLCVLTFNAHANNYSEMSYFKSGLFLSLDLSTGAAINERIYERGRNSCYGIDFAVGYRFMPQLAVAAGLGSMAYSNRTNTCNDTVYREIENTCVPVFLRIRSDFIDRRVSPYVQMDLGYSFMLMYAREDIGNVKYSEQPFSNGSDEYIIYKDSYMQYGMDGAFGSLDLGLSWEIIGCFRMCLALSAGCHQAFLGIVYKLSDGSVLKFGQKEHLAGQDIMTVGNSLRRAPWELDVRVKIAFVF